MKTKDTTAVFSAISDALEAVKSYRAKTQVESDDYTKDGERKFLNNMIMYNKGYAMPVIVQDTDLPEKRNRYCAEIFTYQGKRILLVSFHGNWKLDETDKELKHDVKFSRIIEDAKVPAIKKFILGKYLSAFSKLKVDYKCQHMMIGGDFNQDLDKLLETVTFKHGNQNQKQQKDRQDDFIGLFEKLQLEIVPYTNHRDATKKDGLICDKILSQHLKVTVFCNKPSTTDEGTLVKNFPFSENSLDHHPLFFTIGLREFNETERLMRLRLRLQMSERKKFEEKQEEVSRSSVLWREQSYMLLHCYQCYRILSNEKTSENEASKKETFEEKQEEVSRSSGDKTSEDETPEIDDTSNDENDTSKKETPEDEDLLEKMKKTSLG